MPGQTRRYMVYSLAFFVVLAGCGYGEVSPTTYQYAKALYSICNRRAENQLAAVRVQIEAELTQGRLSEREAKWLAEILDEASDGNWDAATKATRRMMADQVK